MWFFITELCDARYSITPRFVVAFFTRCNKTISFRITAFFFKEIKPKQWLRNTQEMVRG